MKSTIEKIKQLIKSYKDILEQSECVLVENNRIIVLTDMLTVTVDEKGKLKGSMSDYPTQFSEETANRLCGYKWTNDAGDVIKPKAVGYREWYQEKLAKMEKLMEDISKISEL